MQKKFVGVHIDEALWKAIKTASMDASKTMQEWISEALAKSAQYKPESKRKVAGK